MDRTRLQSTWTLPGKLCESGSGCPAALGAFPEAAGVKVPVEASSRWARHHPTCTPLSRPGSSTPRTGVAVPGSHRPGGLGTPRGPRASPGKGSPHPRQERRLQGRVPALQSWEGSGGWSFRGCAGGGKVTLRGDVL